MVSESTGRDIGLITDADNTLWDTDRVFAEAQLWLLSRVEQQVNRVAQEEDRLRFVRKLDQGLAAKHHLGLRYPTVLLVNALTRALRGSSSALAVREALANRESLIPAVDLTSCMEQFEARLRATPPLRVGVDSGLEHAHHAGIPVVVATEGSVDRCRERLNHWGLEGFVSQVVAAPKSEQFYVRIARLIQRVPQDCFVIGDQLDRDIDMASRAGCTTIYFPGGFSPDWAPSVNEVRPHFIVGSFYEVVAILEQARQEPPTLTVLGGKH